MIHYRAGLGDDPERKVELPYGYIEFRYAPGNTCEIVNIEVEGEHRGQGIGRRLIEMLFEEVVKMDVHNVYAITRTDNLIAQQFYEKLRFEVTGVLRRFYRSDGRCVDAIMYGRSPKGPV